MLCGAMFAPLVQGNRARVCAHAVSRFGDFLVNLRCCDPVTADPPPDGGAGAQNSRGETLGPDLAGSDGQRNSPPQRLCYCFGKHHRVRQRSVMSDKLKASRPVLEQRPQPLFREATVCAFIYMKLNTSGIPPRSPKVPHSFGPRALAEAVCPAWNAFPTPHSLCCNKLQSPLYSSAVLRRP